MQIKLLSDLHLEFYSFKDACKFVETVPNEGVSVLVLAGDICLVERYCKDFMQRFTDRFPHVVWVAGNHEFYGSSLYGALETMRTLPFANLHVLENDTMTIYKQRFVGCTLWYDTHADFQGTRMMNDFSQIKNFYFDDILEYARQSQKFLAQTVNKDDVVVTHMLPSSKAIGEKYRHNVLNGFYASPACEQIIVDKQPKAWLHGHSHETFSFNIGKTKVVRNPKGYPGQDTNFDIDFLLGV